MSESAIIFEGVSKRYPLYHNITRGFKHFLLNIPKAARELNHSKFEALKNVSFQVNRGEAFGIIGRNGAGKSTILGLIAGVLKPSEGRVAVGGKVSSILELGAGFHPELTGRENIVLNGVLMGLTRKEALKRMDKIIEFSEIGEFINEPIRIYSSGMLLRLGFSVIAHLEPEILLIDEVLSVGDLDFQKKCLDKITSFKRNNVTIIFVSHSMEDVKKICDRAMWIDGHSVKMIGTNDVVVAAYAN